MTSGPSDEIYDTFAKNITKAGHDKARAFGYSLANSVIEAAQRGTFTDSDNTCQLFGPARSSWVSPTYARTRHPHRLVTATYTASDPTFCALSQ